MSQVQNNLYARQAEIAFEEKICPQEIRRAHVMSKHSYEILENPKFDPYFQELAMARGARTFGAGLTMVSAANDVVRIYDAARHSYQTYDADPLVLTGVSMYGGWLGAVRAHLLLLFRLELQHVHRSDLFAPLCGTAAALAGGYLGYQLGSGQFIVDIPFKKKITFYFEPWTLAFFLSSKKNMQTTIFFVFF